MNDISSLHRQPSGAVVNTDAHKLSEHLFMRQQVLDLDRLKKDVSEIREQLKSILVQNNIPVTVK
jgi:hypothetical protein